MGLCIIFQQPDDVFLHHLAGTETGGHGRIPSVPTGPGKMEDLARPLLSNKGARAPIRSGVLDTRNKEVSAHALRRTSAGAAHGPWSA